VESKHIMPNLHKCLVTFDYSAANPDELDLKIGGAGN